MVWLRGDAGVSPGATFTWTDQSGNGRSGVQATAADQPTVTTTAAQYMNYNPGLNFVANQWLILGTSVNTAGTTASEFYLVYQNVHSAPDGFVLGTETPGNRLYYWGSGVVQLGSSGKPATIAPGYVTGGANIFVGKFFSAADGAQAANGSTFSALAPATAPAALTTPVAVGVQPNNGGGFNAFGYTGNTMEVVGYNAEIDLTGTERQQVESYLALKYGVTLDSVGTGGNYYNSAGSSVYTGGGGNGYFTDIIGIARDDNSTLYQRQSHLANDSVRLYLGSAPLTATTNQTNGNSFAADKTYIVMGDNQSSLCTNATTSLFKPASVISRLGREWKIIYNSTANTFNMDIKLASCAGISTGPNNPADLELLYSTSSSNLTTGSVMANNTNGMTISVSGGVVTIAGLNSALAAIAPATAGGTTVYFTLAATSFAVLPLDVTSFAAATAGPFVGLNWTATGQTDGDHFKVERSPDGANWQQIGSVLTQPGSMGSTPYQFVDSLPLNGANFYRLAWVEADGSEGWSKIREVSFAGTGSSIVHVYPNPAADEIYVQYPGQRLTAGGIRLFSVTGQEVFVSVQGGLGVATVSLKGLAPGVYFLQVKTATGWQVQRLLKNE
ncbi:MAG TPA: T9SS type A sorting domain-containing protein [Puia sp.]|nr:T9SS type A sorting domain-containing protein [Puia sp.]